MKTVFVFVLAIAVSVALPYRRTEDESEPDGCDIFCPLIYTPVCGTDGQTSKVFASSCVMNRQSCLEQKAYRKAENESDCDFAGYRKVGKRMRFY